MRMERLILNELMKLNESLSANDKKEILKVYPNLKDFSKLDKMESGFVAVEKTKLKSGTIVYDNTGKSGEYAGGGSFSGSSATLNHFAMGDYVLTNPVESKVVSEEARLLRDAWLAQKGKGGTVASRLEKFANEEGISIEVARDLAKTYEGKRPKRFTYEKLRQLAKSKLGV